MGLYLVFFVCLPFVSPCGITTHMDIGYRAAEFFDEITPSGTSYAELIKKHEDAFQAATSFPDTFYPGICSNGDYHQVSEDTHWTPFFEAGVKYIRETYPQPWGERAEKLVVFLLGVIQHQVSDVTWHNLAGVKEGFLYVMGRTNFHGSFNKAHPHGDFGGDVLNQVETNTDYQSKITDWHIPVDDLVGIYRTLYKGKEGIPASVIKRCSKLMYLGRLGENIGAINLVYPYIAMKSPFLTDRFQDYFFGGMDDMAAWTSHVWSYTAQMLKEGTEVCHLTENPVYIKCNNPAQISSTLSNYSMAASEPQEPHERAGWHHKDTLSQMIGSLSEDDVLVENVPDMGAVKIGASLNLLTIRREAILNAEKKRSLTLPLTRIDGDPDGGWSGSHTGDGDPDSGSSGTNNKGDGDPNSGSGINQMKEKVKKVLDKIFDIVREKTEEEDDTAPSLPSRTMVPEAEDSYSRLGESLVSADLNGDGFDDIIMGAPLYSEPGNHMAGRVYIKYGSTSASGTQDSVNNADVILDAVLPHSRFGTALAVVDINADGHLDLAVSAPMEESEKLMYKGSVYIYYGKEDGSISTTHGMRIQCTEKHCNMGWSLAGGDLNNDGVRDLIIGCPFASGGGRQRGKVGVFHGKHSFKYVSYLTQREFEWEWVGSRDWSWLGYSVSAGEGWLAVGAPQYRVCAKSNCYFDEADKQSAGQVIMFQTPLTKASAAVLGGEENFGQFGYHVALSADGKTLAVGAVSEDAGSLLPWKNRYQEGRVYLYTTGSFKKAAATLKGTKMLARFGQHIKIADTDGDGIDDVIVGAPLYNGDFFFGEHAQEGRVYIFKGTSKSRSVSGIRSKDASGADSIMTMKEGRSRFGCSFALLHSKGYKNQLAVGSMHSNEAAYLGGAVSFHNV